VIGKIFLAFMGTVLLASSANAAQYSDWEGATYPAVDAFLTKTQTPHATATIDANTKYIISNPGIKGITDETYAFHSIPGKGYQCSQIVLRFTKDLPFEKAYASHVDLYGSADEALRPGSYCWHVTDRSHTPNGNLIDLSRGTKGEAVEIITNVGLFDESNPEHAPQRQSQSSTASLAKDPRPVAYPTVEAHQQAAPRLASNTSTITASTVGLPLVPMYGWHPIPCPEWLSAQRWSELEEFAFQSCLDSSFCPRVGDICYFPEIGVGWMNAKAGERFFEIYAAHSQGNGTLVPESVYDSAVAQLNGALIKLDKGTKVRVLDCHWTKPSDLGSEGKIQILSGPQAGKVCFALGMELGRRPPDTYDMSKFCKTSDEVKMLVSIRASRSLNRNGDVSPNSEELRLHMLLER
jgi:hypothetical protein